MTTHVCRVCRAQLPPSNFNASTLRRNSKTCRSCQAAYQRRWYAMNREVVKERSRRSGQLKYAEAKELIRSLKDRPCADCGLRFPPEAMDFDHVRGKKVQMISRMRWGRTSIDRILTEVAKCDVVCANCHRLRTATRIQESGKRVYWMEPKDDEPGA